jgi:hypothetical protein
MNKMVENIKEKNVSWTNYGNSMYSHLWYCDNKNKICITFTPRGGGSISFQQYLDLVGLLKDGLNYNPFIHIYRDSVFLKNINKIDINNLVSENYVFIKFIMNPYIRAVSIYRAQSSHNLSFREYLKLIVSNKMDIFNSNEIFHNQLQYIEGEEKIITKYIKIDKNETYQITLFDETPYILDVNKYTSEHHGKKNINNKNFCGDIVRNKVNLNLPSSYKYFYDDEIRKMVEIYYKTDIEKYGYVFEDF